MAKIKSRVEDIHTYRCMGIDYCIVNYSSGVRKVYRDRIPRTIQYLIIQCKDVDIKEVDNTKIYRFPIDKH